MLSGSGMGIDVPFAAVWVSRDASWTGHTLFLADITLYAGPGTTPQLFAGLAINGLPGGRMNGLTYARRRWGGMLTSACGRGLYVWLASNPWIYGSWRSRRGQRESSHGECRRGLPRVSWTLPDVW